MRPAAVRQLQRKVKLGDRSLNLMAALAAGRCERRIGRSLTQVEWDRFVDEFCGYDPLKSRSLRLYALRPRFDLRRVVGPHGAFLAVVEVQP